MEDQTEAVQEVVSRYHSAIEEKDAKAAISCVGPTYFRAGRTGPGGAGDPAAWKAGDFTTLESVRRRLATHFKADWTYTNTIEFLHTDVADRAAVVVTKETGKGSGGGWKGVTNLWCLAKIRGRWKIVGSLYHIGKGGRLIPAQA